MTAVAPTGDNSSGIKTHLAPDVGIRVEERPLFGLLDQCLNRGFGASDGNTRAAEAASAGAQTPATYPADNTALGGPRDAVSANPDAIPLPHLRQVRSWDCGLACARMVVALCRKGKDSPPAEEAERVCGTQSVWTVHISELLRQHYCVLHFLTTTCAGVNRDLERMAFYLSLIHI